MRRPPLLALMALALWSGSSALAGPGSTRLSALFLGDDGHHRPADRAAQILPVLAGRGIDVTYTEDVGCLRPETLGKYDALIVYANIDAIGPDAEKALLDYVAGGGGFVPIHCASFCFRNSDAYVALVGAQFQRHGTGEFDTRVVDPDHPITRGLAPFRTWDETYVHARHNDKDRHVLQVRDEGGSAEPWTWTRTQGKGRVFYTAYGHDSRTWEHPAFQDLIERGIRWAANKGEVFDSRARVPAGLEPFAYEESPSPIPNYLPGQKWGTQGEPLRKMQRPLAPAESQKHLALPAGFRAELVAAEPQIFKPIALAWDHRGRLWISETVDYPNELKPKGEGRDRITICDDTDGDGTLDKFTVFADKLSIPTSLAFANGGLVVHQAPDTLFLKDNDGDDKADERRVLFTGWGTRDTHAGPSNLRMGLDGWLYGIVGYSGFSGRIGGEEHRFAQGLYRFRPDGSKLEFLRNTNNNSWGVGFGEDGLLFGSTANGCPSVYLPIPNRYYEQVRGAASAVLQNIAADNRFFPVTDRVRQVDWHGGFTAGAGHALYTARAYPKQYWNSTAFVAEPTGHLVATFTLQRRGSDVADYNGWNLVASDDEWTSPIIAEVGPDGNVWVVDWYSYIVQHNPTPQGFRTGQGGAYETPLRDKTHGRIYRIVAEGGKKADRVTLDPEKPESLVAALKNDNMLWRNHAQRLLVERGKRDVVPDLVKLVRDDSVDGIGLNPGAIHALWALQGLGALDGQDEDANAAALAALKHPSAGVRRNAAQVLPKGDEATKALLSAGLLDDPDAQVRLAALLALADRPASDDAARALVKMLAAGRVEGDRWLPDAATVAASVNDRAFLAALAATKLDRPAGPATIGVVRKVAEHHARGGPADTIGDLIAALVEADSQVAEAAVAGIARGWPRDTPAKMTEAAEKAMALLLGKLSLQAKGELVGLASRWGSRGFDRYVAEIADTFLATARDDGRPERERIGAAGQLIDFRRRDAEAARALIALVTPRTAPSLAAGLIAAVGRSEAAEAGPALVEALPALTPAARGEAVRALLGRAEWTAALVDGFEAGSVPLSTLTLDQKQALAAHPDKALAARAQKLLASGGGLPDPDRQKVIDALMPVIRSGGDPAKGKVVFTQQCAKCHIHGGEGGKVGPDLTGMAAHPRDELVVHILDPSRSVEGNYVQYTVAMNDGRVLNGLLASESKTAVELLDAEGKAHTLQRADIDELVASKKSLMPEGFEKQVGAEGLTDVLAFLTQRGKYLPLDLRKAATIVSTRGMFYDKDAAAERLVFPDWGPKTYAGVPFQLVDPQGDRVPNAVLLYGPQGAFPPQMPRSVRLECHAPARAIHLLGGVSGWGFAGGEPRRTVSMIVRLHYADGKTEDHPLRDGVELADYIRPIDVPGSQLAFRLRGQQLRYLAIRPERSEPIDTIELVKGRDDTAPVVMAVTLEAAE